jgi:dinuclear metal center YbgI/SA1388 family protein
VAASLHEILAAADEILEPERFDDYCVNGLQVPGPAVVETIISGVSASAELFGLAADAGADLVLVHHGLFWDPGVRTVDGVLHRRLQALFQGEMALAAYHLPLDAHPELGNNALLAREVGASELRPFARHHGQTIGWLGRLSLAREDGVAGQGEGVPLEQLVDRVRDATRRDPLVFDTRGGDVRQLAVVTGAGAGYLEEAAAAGAHALLTGEAPERAMALARELGVHLIAAGHYATETFGVHHLGETLAQRFGLKHDFIDVPNPL